MSQDRGQIGQSLAYIEYFHAKARQNRSRQ